MLHDAGNPGLLTVSHGIDVELDRVLQEQIQQNVILRKELPDLLRMELDLFLVDRDPHSLPPQHIARTNQDRVADSLGRFHCFGNRLRHAVGRGWYLELF